MTGSGQVLASVSGPRAHVDPSLRQGQVLVLDLADEPGLYTVILHSQRGTQIRKNVAGNAPWRVKVKGGHHLEFKLTEVGTFPGPMLFGYQSRPAKFETRHPADCPECSGLAAGSLARTVQKERANRKLAKQCR